MFSISNFLPGESSSSHRVSFQDLDWRNSSQLTQIAGGSLLVLLGSAFRRSLIGAALTLGGGRMIYQSLRSAAPLETQPSKRDQRVQTGPSSDESRRRRNGVPGNDGLKLTREITIAGSRKEIFDFVRNVENGPRFLKSVESVQTLDERRSFWTGSNPFGDSVEWYVEIINEHPGEMIAWQSLAGSDIRHAGSIRFEEAPDGNGTLVKVTLEYAASERPLSEVVAGIMGERPEQQLAEDLGRLKFQIETGPTTLRVGASDPVIL